MKYIYNSDEDKNFLNDIRKAINLVKESETIISTIDTRVYSTKKLETELNYVKNSFEKFMK